MGIAADPQWPMVRRKHTEEGTYKESGRGDALLCGSRTAVKSDAGWFAAWAASGLCEFHSLWRPEIPIVPDNRMATIVRSFPPQGGSLQGDPGITPRFVVSGTPDFSGLWVSAKLDALFLQTVERCR